MTEHYNHSNAAHVLLEGFQKAGGNEFNPDPTQALDFSSLARDCEHCANNPRKGRSK